jgi:nucleotide-binding universal stress UspA family protein
MFNKILVPLDGSELAAKILPQVEDLAKTYQSQVTLITIGHFASAAGALEATPQIIRDAADQEKRTSEKYLEKTTGILMEKGLKVDWVYEEAMPAHAIVAYAEKQQMDLIAMATHGKGEVAWVLGSVAEKVISHATVPVLLLRVMEFKAPPLKAEWFMGA